MKPLTNVEISDIIKNAHERYFNVIFKIFTSELFAAVLLPEIRRLRADLKVFANASSAVGGHKAGRVCGRS